MDAKRALVRLKESAARMDIAYVDPPYGDVHAYTGVLPSLIRSGIMTGDLLIGIEHTTHEKDAPGGTEEVLSEGLHSTVYRYGDKCLTVVRRW